MCLREQSEDGCGLPHLHAPRILERPWRTGCSQRADATAIQKQLYSRKSPWHSCFRHESYLKESGFRVFPLNGDWKDLLEQLKQGRPLIREHSASSVRTPLHYVVVTASIAKRGRFHQRSCAGQTSPDRARRILKRNGGRTAIDCCWLSRKGRVIRFLVAVLILGSPCSPRVLPLSKPADCGTKGL